MWLHMLKESYFILFQFMKHTCTTILVSIWRTACDFTLQRTLSIVWRACLSRMHCYGLVHWRRGRVVDRQIPSPFPAHFPQDYVNQKYQMPGNQKCQKESSQGGQESGGKGAKRTFHIISKKKDHRKLCRNVGAEVSLGFVSSSARAHHITPIMYLLPYQTIRINYNTIKTKCRTGVTPINFLPSFLNFDI